MTKQIRIENADTSRWKVKVEVWEKGLAGDIKLREVDLDYPTQMSQSIFIKIIG